jgi:hypothetical protein
MATRRGDGWTADHGAQYFTARDERFQRAIETLRSDGTLVEWRPRLVAVNADGIDRKELSEPRFVPQPGMSSIARGLVGGASVHLECRVTRVVPAGAVGWRLFDDGDADLGAFDVVLVNTPAPQAVPLLEEAPRLAAQADAVRMRPCWTGIFALGRRLDASYDAAFVNSGALDWVARNSAKPGRESIETWVVHANVEFSEANLEKDREAVLPALQQALAALPEMSFAAADIVAAQAHRWRYARPDPALETGCLWDADRCIGACGDWCHAGRVEGAFLSGWELAGRVLAAGG